MGENKNVCWKELNLMSVFVLKNALPNLQVVFRNQIMRNRFSKSLTHPPVLVGSGG